MERVSETERRLAQSRARLAAQAVEYGVNATTKRARGSFKQHAKSGVGQTAFTAVMLQTMIAEEKRREESIMQHRKGVTNVRS